jgi:soluble epoxide hydrolase/lipid-phosphate phosphatase
MWAGAVPHFLKLPNPFVLIDILGLGDSAKPSDPSAFRYKQQADSIAQILDHEGVGSSVIPIGHDWCVICPDNLVLC